jgi:hypothetical protein
VASEQLIRVGQCVTQYSDSDTLYCVEKLEIHKITRVAVLVKWDERWRDYMPAIFVAVDDLVIRTPPEGAQPPVPDERTRKMLNGVPDD